MIKQLFEQQREYLNHFFDHLAYEAVEELAQKMLHTPGMVFFTGIGKSGIIAKKIAMTMMSTGTRSLYLSATNALHGDLGIVNDKDIFVLLSKSGESDELLSLIPFLRNKGVYLVAVVSNPNCRLARACDLSVNLPLIKELCPFGLAPTTSTALQLIFGDVLAVALMQLKKFSLDQYALNHPAGTIGKKITLQVRDLMIKGDHMPLCSPSDRLIDVLVVLSDKRCGCLMVVDKEKRLQGIFTDGDLRRALQVKGSEALHLPMDQLMTRQPRHIGPEVLATEAMKTMEADQKRPIMVLPVLENPDNKVVGIIKMHDIVQSGL